MRIPIKMGSALVGVGVFLVVGAVNGFTGILTGPDGPIGDQQTVGSLQNAPQTSGPWEEPVAARIGTAYGVPGASWASGHHTGVDFLVPTGTVIHAASAGQVIAAGWGGSYGNQVVIKHGNHLYTQYAHLSQLTVHPGDQVDEGQQLGLSGATGNATGPHLHFEVRTGPDYGSDIDPLGFLSEHDAT